MYEDKCFGRPADLSNVNLKCSHHSSHTKINLFSYVESRNHYLKT